MWYGWKSKNNCFPVVLLPEKLKVKINVIRLVPVVTGISSIQVEKCNQLSCRSFKTYIFLK